MRGWVVGRAHVSSERRCWQVRGGGLTSERRKDAVTYVDG